IPARRPVPRAGTHTTIGVVATDVSLVAAEASRMATIAHDGLARAVRPAHTAFDGDTFFALSTSRRELAGAGRERALEAAEVFEAGAACVERAVVNALVAAQSVAGIPSYGELYPSALRP
ncbi:MAG: P1 family peptidase, partial [Acidimicrobiales bacterium]